MNQTDKKTTKKTKKDYTKRAEMSINEVLSEMRKSGFRISQKKFYTCVENDFFPFVHTISRGETGRRCIVIFRKEYESWAKEFLNY